MKKNAVFNKPDVVAALRGWVAAEGDFEACERGVWLRDELNARLQVSRTRKRCLLQVAPICFEFNDLYTARKGSAS